MEKSLLVEAEILIITYVTCEAILSAQKNVEM